ncbi:MAG: VWA domain-containing protein [Epulopiscium sp.]|nr:VWA domain-containing protein [Candidatus Epulonipiscium sp.]
MNFYNPWGFLGLIAIPIIILMYLLKQKYEEVKVPSLFLWEQALSHSEAYKPWQKLRKNLLLFIQLLAAALLVMALAKPYLYGKGEMAGSYILILDSSMSMQAEDEKPNRFENAKNKMEHFINTLEPDAEISLIVMEKEPYILVNKSTEKNTVIKKLKEVEVSNTEGNSEDTASLVQAIYEQTKGKIYLFSDEAMSVPNLDMEFVQVGQSSDNCGIVLLSHSKEEEQIAVLVRVKNFGKAPRKISVSLYGDEELIDVKDVELFAGKEENVFFAGIPKGIEILKAEIDSDDILKTDNTMYDVVHEDVKQKVLLVTEQNIFLEQILSILPQVELYKGNLENEELPTGYYLYIFDGKMPPALPKDGHILAFNPEENNPLVKVEGEVTVDTILPSESKLFELIREMDFAIAKTKKMVLPEWGEEILSSEKTPLIFSGELQKQKVIVCGFDLHDTDLPIKKEFPIFIYNIMQWFIPSDVNNLKNIIAGDTIEFEILPEAQEVSLVDPKGNVEKLAPPFPAQPYKNTDTLGIYVLKQKGKNEDNFYSFAVNPPVESESDLNRTDQDNITVEDHAAKEEITSGNRSLKNIFILLVLLLLILEWWIYIRRDKQFFLTSIRCIVVILLIFSLLGLEIKQSIDTTTTIFAVDLSDSSKASLEEVEDFIQESIGFKSDKDEVGIVSFGGNAVVEISPKLEPDFSGFDTIVNAHSTDISQGIKLSASLIPEESKKRIVLISDGQENMGDALSQAKTMAGQNIKVDVVQTKNSISDEVQLTDLTIPQYLNLHQEFTAQIRVDSLVDNQGVLKIYNGKNLVETQTINIRKGQNRFVFSDKAEEGGGRIYRVELEADIDSIRENNVAYGYTYVEDIPHILLIEKNNSGEEIEKLLEGTKVEINTIEPHIAPAQMDELSQYDGVILANISGDDLDEKFLSNLENYVSHLGGGLVVTGGENAYALGNYFDTPLETLLPVEMELKDKNNIPDMGLMIVTDRSGSMEEAPYGISKLELAKEAAIRAAEVLHSFDKIGVIAFDDLPQDIVKFQAIDNNLENIKKDIASISPGGGTSIIPALRDAYEVLRSGDTKVKHIILLTDGQAERSGYNELIGLMKASGITLSTVAVGRSSDTALLEELAQKGSGRYYYTDEFSDLPKIFMKETMMAGKTYINNETFYPKVSGFSPILGDIEEVAPLNGYIATTPKNRGEVLLKSEKDDPILAVWRYGLGKTAAWTSDVHNQWSSDWLSSDSGVKILRNMISWVLRKPMSDTIEVEGKVIGDQIEVNAQVQNSDLAEEIEVNVVKPDLTQQTMVLKPTAPGRYTGRFDGSDLGAYMLNFQINRNGETESIHTGINIPYSPEYDIRKITSETTLLNKIAQITGGKVLKDAKEVFRPMDESIYGKKDITWILLVLSLLLYLLDIAYRRIGFIRGTIDSGILLAAGKLKNVKREQSNQEIIKQERKRPKKEKPKDNKAVDTEKQKAVIQEQKRENTTAALLNQKRKRIKK